MSKRVGEPGDALVIEWREDNGGEARIVHQDEERLPRCRPGDATPLFGVFGGINVRSAGYPEWRSCAALLPVLFVRGNLVDTDDRLFPVSPTDWPRVAATVTELNASLAKPDKGREAAQGAMAGDDSLRRGDPPGVVSRPLSRNVSERPALAAFLAPRHPMPTAAEAREYLDATRRENANAEAEEAVQRGPGGVWMTSSLVDDMRHLSPRRIRRAVCRECGADHAGPPDHPYAKRANPCATCGCRAWRWSR